MSSYLAAQEASGGVSCNVITVPEECGTADALRLVAGQVSAETLVVASGDILTDLPLRALVATHQVGTLRQPAAAMHAEAACCGNAR
jgi:NDP-sugar pyrophosphorylase family protein